MRKILVVIAILLSMAGYGQTYNPASTGSVPLNTAIGVSNAVALDSRSLFYDAINFRYRPYVDTTEVNHYLNLTKYRFGWFPIVVNTGGMLTGGTIIGGSNELWFYKNGTADTNLVKMTSGDTTAPTDLGRVLAPNGFTITSSTGTPTTVPSGDTTQGGAKDTLDAKKIRRTEIFPSPASLRTLTSARLATDVLYSVTDNGLPCFFYWVPSSTAADDSVMILKVNGITTGRLYRYYADVILVDWFGARAGDGTDDSRAVQKCSDFILSGLAHTNHMVFSGGRYYVENWVLFNDTNHDGQPEYTTIWISGVPQNTELFKNGKTGFLLGGQKFWHSKLDGLVFTGNCPTPNGTGQTITWTTEWFTGGVSHDQYSPTALFVIDPFSANTPSDHWYDVTAANGNPMSQYYTGLSGGGSSEVIINDCSFGSGGIGIMVSPNGYTSNCDNIIFSNGHQFGNRIFWASGQSQSRANQIHNLYSLGGTQKLIDTREFGQGQGLPPSISHSSLAGSMKYLFNTNTFFDDFKMDHTEIESIFALGYSGQSTFYSESNHIDLSRPPVEGFFPPQTLMEGTRFSMIGGSMRYYDGLYIAPTGMKVENLSVGSGAYMQTGPLILDNSGGASAYYEAPSTLNTDESIIVSKQIKTIPGQKFSGASGIANYEVTGPKVEATYMQAETIHIDSAHFSGWFKTSHPEWYQQYDALAAVGKPYEIFSGGFGPFGYVDSIRGGDTVVVGYIPINTTPDSTYDVYVVHEPIFQARTTVNMISGSNVLTGVHYMRGKFHVGNKIKGDHIPKNSYVTYISSGYDTIMISQNVTATATTVPVYDAVYKMYQNVYQSADFVYPWFPGDEMIAPNGSSDTSTWRVVCTTAGIGGGSPAPIFGSINYNGGGGGGASTLQALILSSPPFTLNNTIQQGTHTLEFDGPTKYYAPANEDYRDSIYVKDSATGTKHLAPNPGKAFFIPNTGLDTLVYDDFHVDHSDITSSVPLYGGPWVAHVALGYTSPIRSLSGSADQPSGGYSFYTIKSTSGNHDVSVKITDATFGATEMLTTKTDPAGDYVYLEMGTGKVYSYVGASAYLLISASETVSNGDIMGMRVFASGDSVMSLHNGVEVGRAKIRAGSYGDSSGVRLVNASVKFDDFLVTRAATGGNLGITHDSHFTGRGTVDDTLKCVDCGSGGNVNLDSLLNTLVIGYDRWHTTTDATPYVMDTLDVATDSTAEYSLRIEATKASDHTVFKGFYNVFLKNVGGTITVENTQNALATVSTITGLSDSNVTIAVSGSVAKVTLTGVAATTIKWKIRKLKEDEAPF